MNDKLPPEKQDRQQAAPALIDINTADVTVLSQLPHVGSVIASRIVEHRLRRPFRHREDLMNVPGIGAAIYHELAKRVVVGASPPEAPAPEMPSEPAAEQAPPGAEAGPPPAPEPVPEAAPSRGVLEATVEAPPAAPEPEMSIEPAAELSPPDAQAPPTDPTSRPAPEPSPAEGPEPAPNSRPEARPAPTPKADSTSVYDSSFPRKRESIGAAAGESQKGFQGGRDWNGLIFMSLLGTLLGMTFTLLLLAGINRGTLNLNQQAEVAALSAQAEEMSTRLAGLESAARSLRTRLDALEGLTGRVDGLEAGLDGLSADLEAFERRIGALSDQAEALASEVETFRATADRFDAFLNGLRDLLAGPAAPPAPAGSATPTPAP